MDRIDDLTFKESDTIDYTRDDHSAHHSASSHTVSSDTVYWGGTDSGTGNWDYPNYPPGPGLPTSFVPTIWQEQQISRMTKEEPPMRTLFRITVVNPKTEAIDGPVYIVAQDEAQAMIKVLLPDKIRQHPEKYDICVECVGQVRARKEVQKVKMVKEDD